MSKRLIIIIGSILLVVILAGVGFWFIRSRQPSSSTGVPSSSNPENSGTATEAIPTGSGLAVQPASGSSATANTPSGGSAGSVSGDSVPQRVIQMSDTPQNPMIVYQGRTMTQEEYEKAWASSSTQKVVDTVPSKETGVKSSPDSDKDRDGLTYDEEMKIGTDPNNADTDGDGLTDGQELTAYKTNPRNFDTDGDGLVDGDEVTVYKTDPNKVDTDGDGYSDGVEVKGGYNPLGPGKM